MRKLLALLVVLLLSGCGSGFSSKTRDYCKEARNVLDTFKGEESEQWRIQKLKDLHKAIPTPQGDNEYKIAEKAKESLAYTLMVADGRTTDLRTKDFNLGEDVEKVKAKGRKAMEDEARKALDETETLLKK